jgi:hypothetical protein
MKNRLTGRWLRLVAAASVTSIVCVLDGVPVPSPAWVALVVLLSSAVLALELGWGTRTRSTAQLMHGIDTEPRALTAGGTGVASMARRPHLRDRAIQ